MQRCLIEFLGGNSLATATAQFITADDRTKAWRRPRPLSEFAPSLASGMEISRSLWDRKSLLAHLDIEYVNFDWPAEPYQNPDRIALQEQASESPFCRRAKAYISEHLQDPIRLEEVARTLHVSPFYFCKMFKKSVGLTFTDYLARLRVERTKIFLLDPHRRVSEIAYDVGFSSLTHFNRVFRRLVGKSPSSYRRSVDRLHRRRKPAQSTHAFRQYARSPATRKNLA